jgi:hypothetical protein
VGLIFIFRARAVYRFILFGPSFSFLLFSCFIIRILFFLVSFFVSPLLNWLLWAETVA